MKKLYTLLALGALAVGASSLTAQTSPANLTTAILNATLSGSTGTLNGNGSFSDVFTGIGYDYSLSPAGALSDATPYTYAKTGASTATITEGGTSVALTFTSDTAGTFVATSSGGTQSGSFVVTRIQGPPAIVALSTRLTLAAGGSANNGIVISGNAPRQVVIRAVGPSLAPLGVNNPLPNPILTVFNGTTQIAQNDDWGNDANLQAAFSRVGLFNLVAGSKDSALLLTLNPGVYTTIVKGVAPTDAGDVLMEVYYADL